MTSPDSDITCWFAREVQPHEGKLRSYLHRMVAAADVDDLIQESYVRLLREQARGRIRSPRGLLFTTARNAARDLFRRRTAAQTASMAEIEVLSILDESPGTPEVVSRWQEFELLDAAIQALPERCRAVLLLRRFENLSHREVAMRLGIAVHTVESQLTKALGRCEEFFQANGALP